VWRYDRTAAGDPFPGEPEVVGQWTTLRTGHNLLYVEGDRVLAWEGNGHFRLYRYDRNVTTLRRATVRAPVRGLRPPANTPVAAMIQNGKTLYSGYGIDLLFMSNNPINVDGTPQAYLQTLLIGECKRTEGPTDEQVELFNMRGSIPANEIVVYFVRQLV